MTKPKQPDKPKGKKHVLKPISLYPLTFEESIRGLLAADPKAVQAKLKDLKAYKRKAK